MTQTQGAAGTPFAVLVGIAVLAGAALGAVAAAVSNSAKTARDALDASLAVIAAQSTTAIGAVPRPLAISPSIPRPFFEELVRLGILIVEASIISIDFSSFRKKVVEVMKGVENLYKQNQNPCDDPYMIVRALALQFFELLNKLPANDNDRGQAVIRLTNVAVQWMKAVNDLFNCFELPTPFPNM